MSGAFTVFAVDDDPYVLDVMRNILGSEYSVETFGEAESCLQRMEENLPGMLLLDVRMPGMDGYELCRLIKENPLFKNIPVTFVSGQDTLDSRLKGYDAGGEDFIVKPFEAKEILRKVQVAQQIAEEKQTLTQQLQDSELLSSLVMANMDEYAILLRFVRELISWQSEQEIATGMLEMLHRYQLDGVVQTRIAQRVRTQSPHGVNLPLESSVMNHVRGMERIFEFRNRSVYNYERLTVMVSNVPLHDPDYCGRLRDHLCVAAECAEARLQTIETTDAKLRSDAGILGALDYLGATMENLRQAHHRDSAASSDLLFHLQQALTKAYTSLGLSDDQELTLSELINSHTNELMRIHDRGDESNALLADLAERLRQISPVENMARMA